MNIIPISLKKLKKYNTIKMEVPCLICPTNRGYLDFYLPTEYENLSDKTFYINKKYLDRDHIFYSRYVKYQPVTKIKTYFENESQFIQYRGTMTLYSISDI